MDDQTTFDLLVDLHRDGLRQGPGSDAETQRALDLTRVEKSAPLQVADIGCGTGASALVLARSLPQARIVAVDIFSEFLQRLTERARAAGCSDRIEPLEASMESLPFAAESLDLIWSEGAIYTMGFAAGIAAWRPLLRSGGVIALSEITWLQPDPPQEISGHWTTEYSEIATAAQKITILEQAGYDLLGYFVLPPTNWIEYYAPLENRLSAFLERHRGRPDAVQVAAAERYEADLYRRFHEWFSYGFYVARKR